MKKKYDAFDSRNPDWKALIREMKKAGDIMEKLLFGKQNEKN